MAGAKAAQHRSQPADRRTGGQVLSHQQPWLRAWWRLDVARRQPRRPSGAAKSRARPGDRDAGIEDQLFATCARPNAAGRLPGFARRRPNIGLANHGPQPAPANGGHHYADAAALPSPSAPESTIAPIGLPTTL